MALLCTYNYTSSVVSNQNLCDNYLNDIQYIEFDFGNSSSDVNITYNTLTFRHSTYQYFVYMPSTTPLPYSILQLLQGSTIDVTLSFYDSFPSASAPSGSLSITENGTYDVSSYAEAVVDVPDTVIYGDYHDDLVNIYHAILVCAGVCLVLYFFYCIYRMIIKSSGGH